MTHENKLAIAIAMVSELTSEQQKVIGNFILVNNEGQITPAAPAKQNNNKDREPRKQLQTLIVDALKYLGPDRQVETIVKDIRGRQEKPFAVKDNDEGYKAAKARMQGSYKRFTQEGCSPGGWRLIEQ